MSILDLIKTDDDKRIKKTLDSLIVGTVTTKSDDPEIKRFDRISKELGEKPDYKTSWNGLLKKTTNKILKYSELKGEEKVSKINEVFGSLYAISQDQMLSWSEDKPTKGRLLYSSKQGRDVAFNILTELLNLGFFASAGFTADAIMTSSLRYSEKVISLLTPEYWYKMEVALSEYCQSKGADYDTYKDKVYNQMTADQKAIYVEYLIKNKSKLAQVVELEDDLAIKAQLLSEHKLLLETAKRYDTLKNYVQCLHIRDLLDNHKEYSNAEMDRLNAKLGVYYSRMESTKLYMKVANVDNQYIDALASKIAYNYAYSELQKQSNIGPVPTDNIFRRIDDGQKDMAFSQQNIALGKYEDYLDLQYDNLYKNLDDFYISELEYDEFSDILHTKVSNKISRINDEILSYIRDNNTPDEILEMIHSSQKKANTKANYVKAFSNKAIAKKKVLIEQYRASKRAEATNNEIVKKLLSKVPAEKVLAYIDSKTADLAPEKTKLLSKIKSKNAEIKAKQQTSEEVSRGIVNDKLSSDAILADGYDKGSIFGLIKTYKNLAHQQDDTDAKEILLKKIKEQCSVYNRKNTKHRSILLNELERNSYPNKPFEMPDLIQTSVGRYNRLYDNKAEAVDFVLDKMDFNTALKFSYTNCEIPEKSLYNKLDIENADEVKNFSTYQGVKEISRHLLKVLDTVKYRTNKGYDFIVDKYEDMVSCYQAPPLLQVVDELVKYNKSVKSHSLDITYSIEDLLLDYKIDMKLLSNPNANNYVNSFMTGEQSNHESFQTKYDSCDFDDWKKVIFFLASNYKTEILQMTDKLSNN